MKGLWRRLGWILLAAASLSFLLTGCGQKVEGPKALAIVAGEEITDADVRAEIAKLPGAPANYKEAATAALDKLVEEHLLIAEAQKRNITITDEEIEKRYQALADDYPGGSLDDYLTNHNLDQVSVRTEIKRTMLTAAALEALMSESGETSAADIKNYYDKNPDEFTKGESVVLRRITVGSSEEAELVKKKLSFGVDFVEIAREDSKDSEAPEGGFLGEIEVTKLSPEVKTALDKLAPGAVTDVIMTSSGKAFYMLEERKDAHKMSLEEATGIITNKLNRQRSQQAYPELINRLKNEYKVSIDTDSIPDKPIGD